MKRYEWIDEKGVTYWVDESPVGFYQGPYGAKIPERVASEMLRLAVRRDWDALIGDVHQWQCETFPQAGAESKWHHLKEEIEELGDCLSDPSEIADCFLLLIGIAKVQGLDPFQCIVDKMEVNRARSWGKPDDNGVVKHV